MLPDPPLFSSAPLLGWAVIALVAIVVVSVVLRVLRKAISTTIRLAILVGAVLIAAAALCWLSAMLGGGRPPLT